MQLIIILGLISFYLKDCQVVEKRKLLNRLQGCLAEPCFVLILNILIDSKLGQTNKNIASAFAMR